GLSPDPPLDSGLLPFAHWEGERNRFSARPAISIPIGPPGEPIRCISRSRALRERAKQGLSRAFSAEFGAVRPPGGQVAQNLANVPSLIPHLRAVLEETPMLSNHR